MPRVMMFQPRFAPKVLDGSKPHTIRPNSKNPPKVGETYSLRQWAGKPYRSRQITLCVVVIERVEPISVRDTGAPFLIGKGNDLRLLAGADADLFAQDDGFRDADDLLAWFRNTHGLPFSGNLIGWDPRRVEGFDCEACGQQAAGRSAEDEAPLCAVCLAAEGGSK